MLDLHNNCNNGGLHSAMEPNKGSSGSYVSAILFCFCQSVHKCRIKDVLLVCALPAGVIVHKLINPFLDIGSLTLNRETAADENATCYFPLLDRIADGHFSQASTDQELYKQFIQVLQEDGHMSHSDTLSYYQLALSMRSSTPRIEAHYQYYDTTVEPSLRGEPDTPCPLWVLFNGKQYCSPTMDEARGVILGQE